MLGRSLAWSVGSALVLAVAVVAGCSASNGSSFDDDGTAGAGNHSSSPSSGTGFNPTSTGSGTPAANCDAGDDEDRDKDGWTKSQGDCNDCDPNANPGAIEVISSSGPAADEDCDGQVDNVALCDDGLALDDPDAMHAARALDLCKEAIDNQGGVLSAAWVRANGTPYSGPGGVQHGILDGFGPNVKPQLGGRLLVLSSGTARVPGQPGACAGMSCYGNATGSAPPGFPAAVPGCDGSSDIHDDVGLELVLRAPTNANGYKFNFKFYSFEFAEWVCTAYNDQFIALVAPPPMGAQNGNIVFDSKNNPVSVNIAFFDVCDPGTNNDFAAECATTSPSCPAKPNPYCPSGPGELVGTGFDNCFGSNLEDAGATTWLETTAPVHGGDEFTIRFTIWDTGDENLDSTVLVDAFQWLAEGGVDVGTDPLPDPK